MIRTEGLWFKDEYRRTLILRGVNLGSSSKVPYPDGATHIREGFYDHRHVSLVGRPFPVEEADEHFARLRSWGFTLMIYLLILALAACGGTTTPGATSVPKGTGAVEYAVTEIPLAGPVADNNAEVSGMAWYGDYLILLPQYPNFDVKEKDGVVFALPRAEILAYLDGATGEPLEPIPIAFSAPGLAGQIDGFQGYEALAFVGDQAFLTIEAQTGSGMKGYLVSGRIAPDLGELALDTNAWAEILPEADQDNKSEEALLVAGDTLVTIYEVNGAAINPAPMAHLFDTTLDSRGTTAFPHVEYRITDATALDGNNRFWAINYFFPGDEELLPERDPLAERYGEGPTHAAYEPVERLVEFEYGEAGIELTETPPIQLELLSDDARNWEGLVRLEGRGFLLVTDKFPETILGFVAWPGEE
jgi:hypothetical protein